MSRLHREGGFTLPELLVGMSLMLIIMGASLSVLDQFRAVSTRTDRRADLNDSVRTTTRLLARSLRNLAASPDLPTVVERAGDYDLVFRSVDKPRTDFGSNTRNLRRVRYCLDASAPTRGRIIEQTQRWTSSTPPAVPGGGACPATGWTTQRVVGERVTNRANGANRPLWTFGRTATGQAASVRLNLFMNGDPKLRTQEVSQTTSVFLRNQNRTPTAVFTAAQAGYRYILLNGSESFDPEGQALEFRWFVNGVDVGSGIQFSYRAPAAGTYTLGLEVRDPSGLVDRSADQSVVVQ
jgi:prepilin-type N-terminal cleavage/methylation domain-containing protein